MIFFLFLILLFGFNIFSSHQVTNLEEAVQELWKRRDEADKDLIASLRAAAGLPSQEEIFDILPFSEDEESAPVLVKNEYGRSLKFSLKGLGNNSPRKSKESGKKSSKKNGKKKGNEISLMDGADTPRNLDVYTENNKNDEMQFSNEPPVTRSVMEDNEAEAPKQKYVDEVSATNVTKASRTIRIKSNKPQSLINREEFGSNSSVPKTAHGPKLVIHLGTRSKNTTPPGSEASGLKMGQDKALSKGMLIATFVFDGIFELDVEFLCASLGWLVRFFCYGVEIANDLS